MQVACSSILQAANRQLVSRSGLTSTYRLVRSGKAKLRGHSRLLTSPSFSSVPTSSPPLSSLDLNSHVCFQPLGLAEYAYCQLSLITASSRKVVFLRTRRSTIRLDLSVAYRPPPVTRSGSLSSALSSTLPAFVPNLYNKEHSSPNPYISICFWATVITSYDH